MNRRNFLLLSVASAFLTACGSKFKSYDGPEVTQVLISKSRRRMYLFHHNKVLKAYDVDLGFTTAGHKQFEGDGKTPEGDYFIDRRNPNSSFHLSLGISYPNEADRAFAKAHGKKPGGDIFIHGEPNDLGWIRKRRLGRDWTAGCISVRNKEMEKIYAMVRTGTPIRILP
ncbi:L,D-transpeptidase family protein [Roseovarius sp. B08]|uniref:L,D-transpeptidase family protein n=1 Tax=Roseovarius sp. B08 TaxID=3449223 RepID=UPI003EDC5C0A